MSKSLPFTAATTLVISLLLWWPAAVHSAGLAATPAMVSGSAAASGFDGVVEAVRQTVIAAQVPGAVVELAVKVGDRVSAGQLLLRIDARSADQAAAASDAQVQAARAVLAAAAKDFERQQLLFQKSHINQAALERAESAFKSTPAPVNAQLAQAGAARTQSDLCVVRAPFAGVAAEEPVALGDMAMPGRPLLTLDDPSLLRVSAAVPQTVASQQAAGPLPRIELPGLPGLSAANQWLTPARVQVLPTVDPGTHTVQLRAELPAGLTGVTPGMFARLWLTLPTAGNGSGARARAGAGAGAAAAAAAGAILVSAQAIVWPAEMTGLYGLDPQGKPVLRQVRLGRSEGGQVEVLSGLMPGERVVSDPQAAARAR